jgi:glycosyltransferase involved in cell wall biosynthesis
LEGFVKEQRVKICHITYSFPPPGGGGSETHNHSLTTYLTEKGYDVDVIVVRPSSVSKEDVAEAASTINKGIRVHNIWYRRFPLWVFKVRQKIKEIEKEGKIDVFDIHATNDIFAILFQRRKVIYSLHFFELNCPGSPSAQWVLPCIASFKKCWRCCGLRKYLQWKLIRWLAVRTVTKFMVKYEYLKRLAVASGLKEDQIEVVPHWLDIERFRKTMRSSRPKIIGIDSSDKICIHVGRLSKENGIWELLKAFTILARKVSMVKLVLVGDNASQGIPWNELHDFCRKHHIKDKVIFTGSVAREDVFRYLSLADCALSCQLYHNYNWSLIEYMCAGRPIVATNVGGTTEILKDGYNALLAEVTPESLSTKVEQILENPQLAKELARNALVTVRQKHGFENLGKYEELVRRLKK